MKIETERLELIALDAAQTQMWLEDLPALERTLALICRAEPLEGAFGAAVRGQLARMRANPENDFWYGFWLLVRRTDRAVVGSADFKGPPDARGEVEIGYGLGKAYEHFGYMSEGVAALCAWAIAQRGVRAVTAETLLENSASQAVLRRCGFREVRRGASAWWRLDAQNPA